MENMHSLLRRQLRKQFGENIPAFPGWDAFIEQVNSAYQEFDDDRNMLERIMEISSEELLETNSQLRAVLEAFPDIFFILDSQGIIIEQKSGSTTELYIPPEQLLGQHIEVIYPHTASSPFSQAIEQVHQTGRLIAFEYLVTLEDQQDYYFEARLLPILADHIFVIIRNITEKRLLEEQLRYLSMHDALTGLYNRAYFNLETARLEKQSRRPMALIIGDVDGLKLVNDTLGHEAGDTLLVRAANVLKSSLRDFDFVARIGGDEFAAILSDCPISGIPSVITRIKKNIAAVNSCQNDFPLSISLGYAVRNISGKSLGELFQEADNNMYMEKLLHRRHYTSDLLNNLTTSTGSMAKRGFLDQDPKGHRQKMVTFLAKALHLTPAQEAGLALLAQYRDIGQLGIPDAVFFKEGPLEATERLQIERHPEIGYRIARLSPELLPIADGILRHHEWWNGQGYPGGLAGEEIPLECRILALIDAYNAMTHDRPYRKAMGREEAVAEIKDKAGTQFDPELTRVFLGVIETLSAQP